MPTIHPLTIMRMLTDSRTSHHLPDLTDFVVLPDGARTALIATKNQGGPISIVWGQGNKARCASVDAPGQGEGHYDICQPGGKTIQLS